MKKFWLFAGEWNNDNQALVPEFWAQEGLMYLTDEIGAARLTYWDFNPQVAEYGDTVNYWKPNKFNMRRKSDATDFIDQDARSNKQSVKLDRWGHVTFRIGDGELAKGLPSLVKTHLVPAIRAMAMGVETTVLNMKWRFLANLVGNLGADFSFTTGRQVIAQMRNLKWPRGDRYAFLTPTAESAYLGIDQFTKTNYIGEDGTRLREGSLGRSLGVNWLTSEGLADIPDSYEVTVGALTANVAKGATTVIADGFDDPLVVGSWFTVAGEMIPHRITATSQSSGNTSITFTPALNAAVLNNAVVTVTTPTAFDGAAALDEMELIDMDTTGSVLTEGQLVSHGSDYYGVMAATTETKLMLDALLKTAAANGDVIGVGPAGGYSFAFHPMAMALVHRPLPKPTAGANSAVITDPDLGLSLRSTITYDGKSGKHRFTLDFLYGIDIMYQELGIPILHK